MIKLIHDFSESKVNYKIPYILSHSAAEFF